MYRLTLTSEERQAFDWVGGRYLTGDRFAKLLGQCDQTEPETEWDSEGDITFLIPESVAWNLRELAEEEGGFPCFGPELVSKLNRFLDRIV